MSTEDEDLVRRFFEEVDARNFDSARELVSPDYRDNLSGRAAQATFDELLEVIKAWHPYLEGREGGYNEGPRSSN